MVSRRIFGFVQEKLNVIGEIDACKWFCGWSLDNVDDRLECVSNKLGMKNDIEDIKRLVTSFNTNKPSYASKFRKNLPQLYMNLALVIVNILMKKHYTILVQ